jgi:hypothetical protein
MYSVVLVMALALNAAAARPDSQAVQAKLHE